VRGNGGGGKGVFSGKIEGCGIGFVVVEGWDNEGGARWLGVM